VRRDESSRAHVYEAVLPRETTQRGLVSDLLFRAFAGSAKDLVLAALKTGTVSAQERAEIQALLAAPEEP